MAHKRTAKLSRVVKVKALAADHGATTGEQAAAKAALERMATTLPVSASLPTDLNGQRQPLSDSFVRRLPIPKIGSDIHWDAFAGFGIRINAGGSKVFFFNYRTKTGRQRRYTIGGHPSWTVGAARIEAHRLKRLVEQGEDPLGEIQESRDAATVDELIERFRQEHLSRRREKTQADYQDMIEKWIAPALGKRKVAEVTYSDIDHLHRKITNAGFSYRANRVVAVLSKMFTLGVNWKMRDGRDGNPCQGVERNKEYLRRRYLQDDELARLIKALATHSEKATADAIRLLLMTGARRGEVLSMRWADIDLVKGLWSKPPSSTKQKEWHTVPLAAPAQQLLLELRDQQSRGRRGLPEFVFPGSGRKGHIVEIKRSWRHICKAAGIKNLRIHDLRHSFASALASDGASLPLIGALLGHSNPSTTARYAHLFDSPMRKAVERVGATIVEAGNHRSEGSETSNAAARRRARRPKA
jgi:integrase